LGIKSHRTGNCGERKFDKKILAGKYHDMKEDGYERLLGAFVRHCGIVTGKANEILLNV
jgi:hypothetical protein